MLRFEGDKDFAQPLAEVWRQLTDARFLVGCIPNVDTVSRSEPDEAVFVVRPGLSFIRGSLEVTAHIFDKTEPTAVRMGIVSKGIGSSSTIETVLTLSARDGGTHVHWATEVKELSGLLKLAPAGLIRGAAQKVIGDLWDRVAVRLQESH